jgi:outer membrane lipoprotein SlyB
MRTLVIVVVRLVMLSGCTTTQKGAGAGAVLGGGAGYAIGKQSGHGGEGAAIGAAVGAIGGALIGNKMEKKNFCPQCGRTFSSSVEYCPYDGTALRPKE